MTTNEKYVYPVGWGATPEVDLDPIRPLQAASLGHVTLKEMSNFLNRDVDFVKQDVNEATKAFKTKKNLTLAWRCAVEGGYITKPKKSNIEVGSLSEVQSSVLLEICSGIEKPFVIARNLELDELEAEDTFDDLLDKFGAKKPFELAIKAEQQGRGLGFKDIDDSHIFSGYCRSPILSVQTRYLGLLAVLDLPTQEEKARLIARKSQTHITNIISVLSQSVKGTRSQSVSEAMLKGLNEGWLPPPNYRFELPRYGSI